MFMGVIWLCDGKWLDAGWDSAWMPGHPAFGAGQDWACGGLNARDPGWIPTDQRNLPVKFPSIGIFHKIWILDLYRMPKRVKFKRI